MMLNMCTKLANPIPFTITIVETMLNSKDFKQNYER